MAGNSKPMIEIMSPAGSYEALMAAIQGGADSVYFGVGKLNMRSRSSQNFNHDDLEEIVEICRKNNLKSYLTLNTIIYDAELPDMKALVNHAKNAGISAIIASDFSVIEYCRKQNVPVHISTQCNITNIEAVKFYSQFADVMVLARELSLEKVYNIHKGIKNASITGPSGNLVRLEVFVHGALCMAISGKCYLSLDNMNFSANRGACLQLCRRSYLVTDIEEKYELEIDHEYIMSPKDLCTIGFLDKITDAGVSVLKIEGRGRGPEYVKTVTSCYKEAIDAIKNRTYSPEKIKGWGNRLKTVFNRGFWDGYYLGRKIGEWSERYGSQASRKKVYAGKVTNFFSNISVAEIKLEAGGLNLNDLIVITGPTTGVVEEAIKEIRVDHEVVKEAEKGSLCSLKTSELVRRGDKVYKLIDVKDRF